MISDKDLSEYREYCSALRELQNKYSKRKHELRLLLEETSSLRKETYGILLKANRFTRHLTGRQRQITGLSYRLVEIEARIKQIGPALRGPEEALPAELPDFLPENNRNRLELKKKGIEILAMIDDIRMKILQLDLLELRCRELILSINKALEAFRHEARIIRRKIYPFGIFSLVGRVFRGVFGSPYFSFRDMEDVAALGTITRHVLSILDLKLRTEGSPLAELPII